MTWYAKKSVTNPSTAVAMPPYARIAHVVLAAMLAAAIARVRPGWL